MVFCWLGFLFCIFGLIFIAPWQVHSEMVKSSTDTYGYADFNAFIREFHKYHNWDYDPKYRSYFGIGEEYKAYKIHADIIMFEEKGMILDFASFYKMKKWMKAQHNIYIHPVIKSDSKNTVVW